MAFVRGAAWQCGHVILGCGYCELFSCLLGFTCLFLYFAFDKQFTSSEVSQNTVELTYVTGLRHLSFQHTENLLDFKDSFFFFSNLGFIYNISLVIFL